LFKWKEPVPVQRIDLNLFRVFEAILQHRSITGASRQLGVTPSAVSHALARLRQALADELFVVGASGMEPTPRALQLAPDIRDGLGRIDIAVGSSAFVPAVALRTFRVAASDYVATMILPPLLRRIGAAAPQIDLRIFPVNRTDVIRQLDDGRVDLVLGWFGDLPDRVHRKTIFRDTETLVVRAGHPLTEGAVTVERLFAFPHVVVEFTGDEEHAGDGFLNERGVPRRVWIERLLMDMNDRDQGLIGRVAISVPHFATVPALLRATDMVATLPRRFARGQPSLVALDLPYAPLVVDIEAIWHQRAGSDAGLRWLVDAVAAGGEAGEPSA
jgi:DNA-binding transcriptional LysR family regulator